MSDPMDGNWPTLDASPAASAQMIDWYAPETASVLRDLFWGHALLWAADRIEAEARQAIADQQARVDESRWRRKVQARVGHGSSALIGIARQMRAWADEPPPERAMGTRAEVGG